MSIKEGLQKIEDGVVDGYKKIEDGVVDGFNKVTDKCVEKLFAKEGETVEEAKKSGCQGLRSLDILLLFGNMLQKTLLFFYLQTANAGDIMHLLEKYNKKGR